MGIAEGGKGEDMLMSTLGLGGKLLAFSEKLLSVCALALQPLSLLEASTGSSTVLLKYRDWSFPHVSGFAAGFCDSDKLVKSIACFGAECSGASSTRRAATLEGARLISREAYMLEGKWPAIGGSVPMHTLNRYCWQVKRSNCSIELA